MRVAILFLSPALLLYVLFELIPIGQTFYFSLHSWPGIHGVPLKYVGLGNFFGVFRSPAFWLSIRNIIWYVVLSLAVQIPIGYLLAFLLSSFPKGYRFFKTAFFSPLVLSVTAVGLMWYFILYPNGGSLNTVLTNLGLESWTRNWLVDRRTAMTTIILVTGWISTGYYMTIGFAAVTGLPEDVLEAAVLDGAVGLKKVFFVMLPMIWETVKVSIVMVVTGILKTFEIVFIMTEGGPNGLTQVPVTLMYYEAFKYDQYGRGSAIAVIVFLMSILASILALRLARRESVEY